MNMGGPPTSDPADRPFAPGAPAQDWAPIAENDPPPRRPPATSLPDDVKVAPLDPAAAPARPPAGAHRVPRREPPAPPPGPPGPASRTEEPAADTGPAPEKKPGALSAVPPAQAPPPAPGADDEPGPVDAPPEPGTGPGGLSAEPTPATPGQEAERAAAPSPGDFLRTFTGGDAWEAMLAVAEEAFAGTGVREALALRIGEALEQWATAPRELSAPVPVWGGTGGLVLDLSARFPKMRMGALGGARHGAEAGSPAPAGAGLGGRAGFHRRHGVLVIDTLRPRAVDRSPGHPGRPGGEPAGPPVVDERAAGPDTDVVIVADLREAGARMLDAAALWRYACRAVTAALYDPQSPPTWDRTRRGLRGLRHVGCLDPELGLGVVLHLDQDQRPRCPLGFVIETDPATGRATARLLRP